MYVVPPSSHLSDRPRLVSTATGPKQRKRWEVWMTCCHFVRHAAQGWSLPCTSDVLFGSTAALPPDGRAAGPVT
jgi:hypothetical protein